jgi:hypothetical protein
VAGRALDGTSSSGRFEVRVRRDSPVGPGTAPRPVLNRRTTCSSTLTSILLGPSSDPKCAELGYVPALVLADSLLTIRSKRQSAESSSWLLRRMNLAGVIPRVGRAPAVPSECGSLERLGTRAATDGAGSSRRLPSGPPLRLDPPARRGAFAKTPGALERHSGGRRRH